MRRKSQWIGILAFLAATAWLCAPHVLSQNDEPPERRNQQPREAGRPDEPKVNLQLEDATLKELLAKLKDLGLSVLVAQPVRNLNTKASLDDSKISLNKVSLSVQNASVRDVATAAMSATRMQYEWAGDVLVILDYDYERHQERRLAGLRRQVEIHELQKKAFAQSIDDLGDDGTTDDGGLDLTPNDSEEEHK